MMTIRAMPVAVVALAGCGDSPAEIVQDLTREEATALLSGIAHLAKGEGLTVDHRSQDSIVASCSLGGTLTVKETDRDRTSADTLWFGQDRTVFPVGCGFSADGMDFGITGDPSFRQQMEWRMIGYAEEVHMLGEMDGAFQWRLDDREGRCEMNVGLEFDLGNMPSGDEPVGTFKGEMCDHQVEADMNLEKTLSRMRTPGRA